MSTRILGLCALVVVAVGCSSDYNGLLEAGTCFQSVANPSLQPILGFETLSDWSIASYSTGTLAHSTKHTEGQYSLSVTNNGYTTVQSIPMAAPTTVGNWVAVDIYLPTPASQSYAGALQAYVQIPSQNLYNAYLGQQELTGLPTNQWITLIFPVSASAQQPVLAAKNDLQLIFAINMPSGANSTRATMPMRMATMPPMAVVTATRATMPMRIAPKATPTMATRGLTRIRRAMSQMRPTSQIHTTL
jgi:hypothetical protein